jgi:hypothetical protein
LPLNQATGADTAVDQVRVGDQRQDRQGARTPYFPDAARHPRLADRLKSGAWPKAADTAYPFLMLAIGGTGRTRPHSITLWWLVRVRPAPPPSRAFWRLLSTGCGRTQTAACSSSVAGVGVVGSSPAPPPIHTTAVRTSSSKARPALPTVDGVAHQGRESEIKPPARINARNGFFD